MIISSPPVSQTECNFELLLAEAKGVFRKVKQGGGASMRRSLLKAKLKLSQFMPCIILFRDQVHARRALSKGERCVSRIAKRVSSESLV
eukprot:2816039-Pleurochrysis_carterae.AAC.4